MDNQNYDPAELAHKWEQGTISPEERTWFEQWYASFNDEEVLIGHSRYSAPEQIRDNVFERITAQMEPQQRPAAKVFHLWKSIAAAAVVLLAVGLALFYQRGITNLVNPVQQVAANCKAGEHRQISLPDGTKVWLSPSSRIIYPNRFENKREVSLSGEAFFEVVHDTKHPFIISSGRMRTVVLGTSFNVRAYPKAPSVEVTVVSGKVGVMMNTKTVHQQQIIVANQRTVFYPATGQLLKQDHVDGARFLDQRNGLFHFNGASLADVVSELQLQYGINITIAPGLSHKAFYGSLNTTVSTEQTLNKLCTVMEIRWERTNGGYYLEEKN